MFPRSVVIPVRLHRVQLLTRTIDKEGDSCFTEMRMSCKTIFKKTKHYLLNIRKLKEFIWFGINILADISHSLFYVFVKQRTLNLLIILPFLCHYAELQVLASVVTLYPLSPVDQFSGFFTCFLNISKVYSYLCGVVMNFTALENFCHTLVGLHFSQ